MRKQNEAKTFAKIRTSCGFYFFGFVLLDSLKVSDSPLIRESPKWILRYAQYDDKIKLQIRATNRNRSNCSITLRYFGAK